MQDALLPLFPLRAVLLPGAPLPLHIFEERYKELIGQAIAASSEFGVVQAGEQGILNIGCTATVDRVVNRYEDGRLDIITVGRRRFEIILLDQEKDYLRAAVTFFDDEDEAGPVPLELKALALAGLKVLTGETNAVLEVPDYDDPQLSFKVGQLIADLDFRQTLLSLRSESGRLKHLAAYLPEYVARARRIAYIKTIARKNGHGVPHGENDG